MNHLTVEQLEEFFEQYGWTYSRESRDTWITGVRTRVSAFRIMVRVTEHWVFFIINPLIVAPARPQDRLRVYYHALRYNLDMNFAKLGVDSDGDIFMAIEMPTENFQYSHFVDALDGLSHHASMIYAELFGLAHSPERSDGRYDDELKHHTLSYLSRWGPASFGEDELDSDLLSDIIAGEYDEYFPDYDDDDDDDDDMYDFDPFEDGFEDENTPYFRYSFRPFKMDDVETGKDRDRDRKDNKDNSENTLEDVFIAGRRLKITDDESGKPRVELENDSDDDTSPGNTVTPADSPPDPSPDSSPKPG